MAVSSIAIWNKNKIAVATATGVWITNVALLIQGEPLFSVLLQAKDTNLFGLRYCSGK